MQKIILLNGKAQAGKDTSFSYFKEYFNEKCKRFSFADYLKEIAKDDFSWQGEKDTLGRNLLIKLGQTMKEEVSFKEGKFWFDDKSYLPDDIVYINKFNQRAISYIYLFSICYEDYKPNINFWVNKTYNEIKKDNIEYNIITDWRFKNEIEYLKSKNELKIFTINIEREKSLQLDDRSEKECDDLEFDYYIDNNGTLDQLNEQVYEISRSISMK